MNTVNLDIINFLQYIGCGTFGENLFFGRVPNSNKVQNRLWWVMPTNTNLTKHNVSGEDSLEYIYELNFRSTSMQDVDEEIFRITKEILGSRCYELTNYKTIEVRLESSRHGVSVDGEGRATGCVCFSAKVYDILNPRQ